MSLPANRTSDETTLADYDATGLGPGTRVYRLDTETDWVYTVGGTGGVAIANVSGAEWIEDTGGGGGTVETDSTLSGDGSSGDPLGIQSGNVAAVQAVMIPAVTATVSGAAATDVDLDLSALGDGDYEIAFSIIAGAAGSVNLTVQPNSVSTNQQCVNCYQSIGGTPSAGGATASNLYLVALNTGYKAQGRFYLKKVGALHFYHSDGCVFDGSDAGKFGYVVNGRWNVAIALTGIRIHSDTASGIGVGSVFTARRMVLL